MKNGSRFADKVKQYLLYGGICKEEYDQVKKPVAQANHKALTYWSALVPFFWIYCLLMSLNSAEYAACRPAYIAALGMCIAVFLCSRYVVPRRPDTLPLLTFFFRLSLLLGGVWIAICQPNLRSLTMFAVAIVSPCIFIDNTLSSVLAHLTVLVFYILFGRNAISPDIYSWGLGNYILFSVFGFLIGNAINRERFERYVFAESERTLLEEQKFLANYDQLTGLRNRRSYEEKLFQLAKDPPPEYCVIMVDINGLKKVNDTIGHIAGDELITGATRCLTAAFDGIDTIYRTGGDEFCVIMDGPVENAQLVLTRLEELTSQWKGSHNCGLSVSFGAASGRASDSVESVVIEADRKMYEYKRNYYITHGVDRRRR